MKYVNLNLIDFVFVYDWKYLDEIHDSLWTILFLEVKFQRYDYGVNARIKRHSSR